MSEIFETVEGRFTNETGNVLIAPLRLSLESLGPNVPVDVKRCELVGAIPDGRYTLEYFYVRTRSQAVRVESGNLLSSLVF
jgi:hypothetical protein